MDTLDNKIYEITLERCNNGLEHPKSCSCLIDEFKSLFKEEMVFLVGEIEIANHKKHIENERIWNRNQLRSEILTKIEKL